MATTVLLAQRAATGLVVDSSLKQFLPPQSNVMEARDKLRKAFGSEEGYFVLVEGDVFTLDYLERLRALQHALSAIDIRHARPAPKGHALVAEAATEDDGWGDEGGTVIDRITSLINVRDTRWEDGALHVGGLLDDWPTKRDLPALKERVLHDHELVGRMVGANGKYSVMVVQPIPMSAKDDRVLWNDLSRIVANHDAKGFHVSIGGAPAVADSLNQLVWHDLRWLCGLEVLLMVICLFAQFRHPLGVIGPLFAVVQAVIWTAGLMAFLGIHLTVVTTALGPLLICVGLAGAIHIQSVYRDERHRGRPNDEAIVRAVETTGVPVLLSAATTGFGLLTLSSATLRPLRDLGLLGAFGVFAAFAFCLIWMPLILSLNTRSLLGLRGQGRWDVVAMVARSSERLSRGTRGRRTIVFVTFAVAALSFLGISKLDVTHDSLAELPKSSQVRRAIEVLDQHLSGAGTITLLVEARDGQRVTDRPLLLSLQRLERYLLAYRDPADGQAIVGHATGLLDVIRESWREMSGGSPKDYRIPDTQRGVDDMLTVFGSAAPDDLRHMMTIDGTKARMSLRVKWRDSAAYRPLVAYIQRGIDKYIGDRATVTPTGTVMLHNAIENFLLHDFAYSFGGTLVVITLLITLMLRDPKMGLIAMVPNLVPIAAVLGLMGLSSINLDLGNMFLACLAIGIAVDDTIHLTYHFRVHYMQSGDPDAAIRSAFQQAGRAVVTTSLVLMIGFSAFLWATLPALRTFGMLAIIAVGIALIADLLFTPALLRTVYQRRTSAHHFAIAAASALIAGTLLGVEPTAHAAPPEDAPNPGSPETTGSGTEAPTTEPAAPPVDAPAPEPEPSDEWDWDEPSSGKAKTEPAPPEVKAPSLTFSGFARSNEALWLQRLATQPLAKARQSIDLALEHEAAHVQWKLSGHAEYDLVYLDHKPWDQAMLDAYESKVYLGDSWISYHTPRFQVVFGRQIVAWGAGQVISPVDVVNPRDLREPGMEDLEDLRLPVLSTDVAVFLGYQRIDAMIIHEASFGFRCPPLGPFTPYGGATFGVDSATADSLASKLATVNDVAYQDSPKPFGLSSQQYLLRWSYRGPGVDVALYGASVLDQIGVVKGFVGQYQTDVTVHSLGDLTTQETDPTRITVLLDHPRYTMVGASGSIPAGPLVFDFEARTDLARSFNVGTTKGDFPVVDVTKASLGGGMLGVTWSGLPDTLLFAEVGKDWFFREPADLLFPETLPVMAVRAHRSLLRKTLSLDAGWTAFGWWAEFGWMLRAQFGYTLGRGFTLSGGLVGYQPTARLGPFSGFEKDDRAFLELRYDFLIH